MARFLIISGVFLIVAGIIVHFGGRLGLGKLPGDIHIERDNFRFSFPIVTCIIVSVLLSVGMALLNRFFR